ncbi:hypothetical protein MMC20_008152 [Loxospora ochrophaea]|nr:hypothetical protein [Loxospora ochrophaea]
MNGNKNTNTETQNDFEKEIRSHFEQRRKNLQIVKTTKTPSGQTVDWIPIESQGTIATPPPLPAVSSDKTTIPAVAELNLEGAEKGPEGTVPILQKNLDAIDFKQPLAKYECKVRGARPPGLHKTTTPAATPSPQAGSGVHRYGSSDQPVTAYGTTGNLSYWDPAVQTTNDFSLLQTGMINTQQGYDQTVEAGWQVYQQVNGDENSHLFTYFTVNGYTTGGNNLGGYNQDVTGWVQYSSSIFPGTTFSPLSVQGGTQTTIGIQYQLFEGNWWLGVLGSWAGYYPASLFTINGSLTNTLGTSATNVGWWGEVYDDQTEASGYTTTDMGSGQFPSAGFEYAAFMNNLVYQADAAGTNMVNYDGSAGIVQEDPNMYQIEPEFNSGTSWGSYAWVGGPGAG